VDYDCDWQSFVIPQTHHLEIALESNGPKGSGGYSYSQAAEIWLAANATKSDVIGMWWTSESTFQKLQGTPSELHRVSLSPPTQECIRNRISIGSQCSANITEQVGNPLGVCDYPHIILWKGLTASVQEYTIGTAIPEALHNPAYSVLKGFRISSLQMSEIFQYWNQMQDPREAVCQWIIDNDDYARNFIPRSYPRSLEVSEEIGPIVYTSMAIGTSAVVLVLFSILMVLKQRKKSVMVLSQVDFLLLILSGLFLIAIGALVMVIPPSNSLCVLTAWLINIGYTLALVPLIVKIGKCHRM